MNAWIELPVAYTVALSRRVNPFHWALLRTVQTFQPGLRPDFDTLARRLQILERAFLDKAWSEIVVCKAVDDEALAQARLSLAGEAALRSGYFVVGPEDVRLQALYFNRAHGSPLRAEQFEVVVQGAAGGPPGWSQALTAERIAEAVALQAPLQRLKPGERILGFTAQWENAQEAGITVLPA